MYKTHYIITSLLQPVGISVVLVCDKTSTISNSIFFKAILTLSLVLVFSLLSELK